MKHKYVYLVNSIPDRNIQINEVGKLISKSNTHGTVHFLKANLDVNVPLKNLEVFNIEETGDQYHKKVCDRCFCLFPTSMFQNNRIKKDNFITKRPSCQKCRSVKEGKSISQFERSKWERSKPEEYSLFACPICEKRTIVGITKVVLDHNHKNGKVRGWLCESCNTGIGRFDDNYHLVEKAKRWLIDN